VNLKLLLLFHDPHAIQVREEGLDSLIARIALAAIARSKDNLDEALRLFNLVLSDNATCVPALVWRGELRLKMGDYKGALIDLCSARIQTIRDSDALTCYGRVLCSLKRCPEAIEILKKAQRLDVHSPWPAVALGVCLEQNGKHEQANAQLLKASKLAPSLFQ
jgi:tetratricopeptide (TPR) repeat protein